MAVATLPTIDAEIADAKRARLHELQKRAAKLGYSTPPEVVTEIAEIHRDLGDAPTAAAPLTEADRHQALFRAILLLSGDVQELRGQMKYLLWALPILILVEPLVQRLIGHL